MIETNKTHISFDELSSLIANALKGKRRLDQLRWKITRTMNSDRGENFNIEIESESLPTPAAMIDANDLFVEIKGRYWLT